MESWVKLEPNISHYLKNEKKVKKILEIDAKN